MPKPKAVLISDIHYNTSTLPVADAALRLAVRKASSLCVPLIIAGDLHDTKAIVRGECIKAIMETLKDGAIVIPGNHCMINSHGTEHALEFLRDRCEVIDRPFFHKWLNLWLVPYHHNNEDLQKFLRDTASSGQTLIMHQGVMGADMGHYIQDKTSLPKEAFADFRVISGHYHKRQDIKCGRPRKGAVGLFSYLGNPYTLSFGEANDGPKGFSILMDDGSLEFVPTNLRKHVIIELDPRKPLSFDKSDIGPNDLVWVKVTGTRSELDVLDKNTLGNNLFGHSNYKLEKIYTDTPKLEVKTDTLTDSEILDSIIDSTNESETQKQTLKELWRSLP